MPLNEGAASIEVEARDFSYDSGIAGQAFTRPVAVEAPVEVVIGGAPFAVMMATPRDLEDFAHGFLLTEGVAGGPDDIRGIEIEEAGEGWRVSVTLTGEKLQAHLARKRAIGGRTGCGLCGVEDLSQMPSPQRAGGPPAADRAFRDRLGALGAREAAAAQRADPRGARRRLVRSRRADCAGPRRRRPP